MDACGINIDGDGTSEIFGKEMNRVIAELRGNDISDCARDGLITDYNSHQATPENAAKLFESCVKLQDNPNIVSDSEAYSAGLLRAITEIAAKVKQSGDSP
jgi:hypothetical protein